MVPNNERLPTAEFASNQSQSLYRLGDCNEKDTPVLDMPTMRGPGNQEFEFLLTLWHRTECLPRMRISQPHTCGLLPHVRGINDGLNLSE